MTPHKTSISSPIVHLLGPGKLKILNGRLAFSTGSGTPTRFDPTRLKHILCYGQVGISDEAFRMLFHHKIQVSWLSSRGARFRGRLTRVVDQAASLRMRQHRAAEDPQQKLELAREIVADKLASQVMAARHYQRHGHAVAKDFLRRVPQHRQAIQHASSLDVLRGFEGSCSKLWFALLGRLIAKPWRFTGRVRRPPTDPVNALLSLGYTWLLNRMIARLDAEGLEVPLGMLHAYRPGRPSLACDLIEPLRVPLVDRWVLESCSRAWVKPEDFVATAQGVRLEKDAFGSVLGRWENAWLQTDGARLLEQRIHRFVAGLRQSKHEPATEDAAALENPSE